MDLSTFTSLRCPLCKQTFVPCASDPKALHFTSCGRILCKSCFDSEVAKEEEQRTWRCPDHGKKCVNDIGKTAYVLIDMMESLRTLKAPTIKAGTMTFRFNSGKFEMKFLADGEDCFECFVCNNKYTNDGSETDPRKLLCGHAICCRCAGKLKTESTDAAKGGKYKYRIKCPKCATETLANSIALPIPSINDLMYEFSLTSSMLCCDCKEQMDLKNSWRCSDCHPEVKGMEELICSRCTLVEHRTHKFLPLQDELIEGARGVLAAAVRLNCEAHTDLMETAWNSLTDDLWKLLKLADYATSRPQIRFSRLTEIQEYMQGLYDLSADFERETDDFFGGMRIYHNKIQDLNGRLVKQCGLNVDDLDAILRERNDKEKEEEEQEEKTRDDERSRTSELEVAADGSKKQSSEEGAKGEGNDAAKQVSSC